MGWCHSQLREAFHVLLLARRQSDGSASASVAPSSSRRPDGGAGGRRGQFNESAPNDAEEEPVGGWVEPASGKP